MMKHSAPILVVLTLALAVAGGAASAAESAPAASPLPTAVSECPDLSGSGLLDVRDGSAGPYLLDQPASADGSSADGSSATVLFLPGGGGSPGAAALTWERFFGSGGSGGLRVIIPYADDGNLFADTAQVLPILDEVLACAGGNPGRVHLAGTSNGGIAAFGLMLTQPERFATLLGAPGLFPGQDPASLDQAVLAETFAGRAVFDGVGQLDEVWKPGVLATHAALVAAGIDAVFVEFPGQGHIPEADFDNSALLAFWQSH